MQPRQYCCFACLRSHRQRSFQLPDFVLNLAGIEDHDGVAVCNTHDSPCQDIYRSDCPLWFLRNYPHCLMVSRRLASRIQSRIKKLMIWMHGPNASNHLRMGDVMKTLMAVLMLLVSTSLLADPYSNALKHANCNARFNDLPISTNVGYVEMGTPKHRAIIERAGHERV